MSHYRHWTNKEVAVLRELYPIGGALACMDRLDRTRTSIRRKAQSIGLVADNCNVQLLARGRADEVNG